MLKAIKSLRPNKEPLAICVYGSRIAGYATDSSDYDVIAIYPSYAQKIRYSYLKDEIYCSALVVDSKSFENDCKKSSLGEFVSGRLLNCYESILGEDFLRENEVIYKKRVIMEGLLNSYLEYLHFAEEINFKLEYFLFEKLRRRASIYPPVVYSYSRTYSDKLRDGNVAASLRGFKIAARSLHENGDLIFDEESDTVKLIPDKLKTSVASKLLVGANYAARSITQYAVHGYAGRVGVDIVGREVLSKISRSKNENFTLPDEIKNPKIHMSISQGRLFTETDNWLGDLLEHLGISNHDVKVIEKSMGEIYASTRIFMIESKNASYSFAVKKYQDIKAMKWGLLSIWSLKNTNFAYSPFERMTREYRAYRDFKKIGIRTPNVLSVFLSQRILVSEFIPGKDLSQIESDFLEDRSKDLLPIERFGKTLGKLHQNHFCMGDSKPSSAISKEDDGDICLVDLEQAHFGGNQIWDVAEFVYYSVRFTLKEESTRKLVGAFLKGYLAGGGKRENVSKATSLRYRAPFQPFIAPVILSGVLEELKSYSK